MVFIGVLKFSFKLDPHKNCTCRLIFLLFVCCGLFFVSYLWRSPCMPVMHNFDEEKNFDLGGDQHWIESNRVKRCLWSLSGSFL